jgi:7,8-dihydropterin-6-yl-methyl-4-(beta-D-ribofuranosyl)aminobenzene 5'-phosphate synthase
MDVSSAAELIPLTSLQAQVVVDNVTDSLSSVLQGVTNENDVLRRYGMRRMSGGAKCCAHHGLSLLLRGESRDGAATLLFDAGPEAYTFGRNAERLGLPLGEVGAIALSHGHWDHGGGLLEAVRRVSAARGSPVPCHLHDGMLVERGNLLPDGGVLPYEELPSIDELTAAGAEVVSSPEPRLLLDGHFYLSGEIPRVTSYERGYPGHLRKSAGGEWEPDPLLLDERYLAAHVAGQGIVVFTACSHAGVVNVLEDARRVFGAVPVHAVMGGLHLSGAKIEPIIGPTVEDMARFDLGRIVPAHCTGWRAVYALVQRFGEGCVTPSAVGRAFDFRAH